MLKACLVNFNFTPTWLLTSGLDYLIYDRSDSPEYLKDFDRNKIIHRKNVGQVDFDKLMYLSEQYENLPATFVWGKTNLFKYITPEEFNEIKENQLFTPILTQNHKIYADKFGDVCYYESKMYYERNDSWYVNQFEARFCKNFGEFAQRFGLPSPSYLPFAPGGNYILTKEIVHKHPKELYEEMASLLPYCREPAEAQMCERSYYLLWK